MKQILLSPTGWTDYSCQFLDAVFVNVKLIFYLQEWNKNGDKTYTLITDETPAEIDEYARSHNDCHIYYSVNNNGLSLIEYAFDLDDDRQDPELIAAVKKLGKQSTIHNKVSTLKVVTLPEKAKYYCIYLVDGREECLYSETPIYDSHHNVISKLAKDGEQ